MNEKQRWLDFWNLSGEEGEKQWAEKQRMDAGLNQINLQVVGDIQPYRGQVDGKMISGRRQHREYLKRHSLIEIGNEVKHLKPYGDYTPKGVKQDLLRAYHQVKDKQRHG